ASRRRISTGSSCGATRRPTLRTAPGSRTSGPSSSAARGSTRRRSSYGGSRRRGSASRDEAFRPRERLRVLVGVEDELLAARGGSETDDVAAAGPAARLVVVAERPTSLRQKADRQFPVGGAVGVV